MTSEERVYIWITQGGLWTFPRYNFYAEENVDGVKVWVTESRLDEMRQAEEIFELLQIDLERMYRDLGEE
jgi:hypothetical protein